VAIHVDGPKKQGSEVMDCHATLAMTGLGVFCDGGTNVDVLFIHAIALVAALSNQVCASSPVLLRLHLWFDRFN
jgi:hypothetical protein